MAVIFMPAWSKLQFSFSVAILHIKTILCLQTKKLFFFFFEQTMVMVAGARIRSGIQGQCVSAGGFWGKSMNSYSFLKSCRFIARKALFSGREPCRIWTGDVIWL